MNKIIVLFLLLSLAANGSKVETFNYKIEILRKNFFFSKA